MTTVEVRETAERRAAVVLRERRERRGSIRVATGVEGGVRRLEGRGRRVVPGRLQSTEGQHEQGDHDGGHAGGDQRPLVLLRPADGFAGDVMEFVRPAERLARHPRLLGVLGHPCALTSCT